MRRNGNIWLALALMVLVLACKGNKVGEGAVASQKDVAGFYDDE